MGKVVIKKHPWELEKDKREESGVDTYRYAIRVINFDATFWEIPPIPV